MCCAGPATAQQPTGSGQAVGQPAPIAQLTAGQPGADAQVPFQKNVQLGPQEQVDSAESQLAQMDQASAVVRRQLEQAREARDVVKVLCLNDKLSQIDVAVRGARDRQSSLRPAATRALQTHSANDIDLANHEFTILSVLKQRSDQLVAEANQCLGEELAFVGATQIVTQIDPTLPGDDVTNYPPTDPTLVSDPPQCISCAQ